MTDTDEAIVKAWANVIGGCEWDEPPAWAIAAARRVLAALDSRGGP